MTQLKQMSGDEFVTKLLAGERDFRRIKLEKGYDVSAHERYKELRHKLCQPIDDLKENPINLIQADLSYLHAPELNLPYTKAAGAKLLCADFHGSTFDEANFSAANLSANLSYSNLQGTYFRNANLNGANLFAANLVGSFLTFANLSYANLSCANLYEASLGSSNCDGTNFERADLSNADLERIKNLSNARRLSNVHFLNTKISREDIAVCKKALKERKCLIYESFWDTLNR